MMSKDRQEPHRPHIVGNEMNYNEKLKTYLKEKATIEVVAEHNVTGVLSEVGEDYIAIIHAVEREITQRVAITEGKQKGKMEEQKHIQVIELETILKLTEIKAISQILKKKVK